MYDRPAPESAVTVTGSQNQNPTPGELPVEFDYFSHSETIDWTSSGPTNATQNSFSPSQKLVTPARELTPTTTSRERTPTREISAPAPRSTVQFDYNQQQPDNADHFGGGYAVKKTKPDVPPSSDSFNNGFVLGSMKTDSYEAYKDTGYRRGGPESQWGPSDGDRGRDLNDGGRGRSPPRGGSPGYGRRGGDDYERGGGDDRRGGDDYGRRGGDDYGRRGGDDYGRSGGDDYGRRGGDDYGRRGGDEYGRRGGDDYGRRGGGDYGRRGGDDYGRRGGDDHGRRGGDFDNNNSRPLNKYGGTGPLPAPYAGPPRATSYGAKDFVLPPVDGY
ncbi:hypothetical protein B0H19DRAFT_1179669 [Mycena capillaripes]|nr:hypothetical protein B0H19DRAFT_1179669 [Mycena capillaripes]